MLFVFFKKLGFFCSSFFLFFFIFEGWARTSQWGASGHPVQDNRSTQTTLSDPPVRNNQTPQKNTGLKDQLSQALSLMAEVHESIKQNQYKQFQTQVSGMIALLNQINVFREPQLTYHQRNYLVRQLYTIKEKLRFVGFGNRFQREHLKMLSTVNKELIHISQMYSLQNQRSQKYSIYFCSKTDSAWIQKSNSKAYNPFQKGYQSCGQKIR